MQDQGKEGNRFLRPTARFPLGRWMSVLFVERQMREYWAPRYIARASANPIGYEVRPAREIAVGRDG